MDYCVIIKNYVLKNLLRYGKKISDLPGEVKQKSQYVWYNSSFVKLNIYGYMHRRMKENVNSDYLWVARSGWLFFTSFILSVWSKLSIKCALYFIIQDNKFYFNKEPCWVRRLIKWVVLWETEGTCWGVANADEE